MSEDRRSYTLDSTLETVDIAEQRASEVAAANGFGEDEVLQIAMAVREAAVNAVLHGNAYDPEKKVQLDFERTKGDLVITIRDQGKGLDPGRDSGSAVAGKSFKNIGPRNFLNPFVYGCGGDSSFTNGH